MEELTPYKIALRLWRRMLAGRRESALHYGAFPTLSLLFTVTLHGWLASAIHSLPDAELSISLYVVGAAVALLGILVSVHPTPKVHMKGLTFASFVILSYIGFLLTREQGSRIQHATEQEGKNKAQYEQEVSDIQSTLGGMKFVVENLAKNPSSNGKDWQRVLAEMRRQEVPSNPAPSPQLSAHSCPNSDDPDHPYKGCTKADLGGLTINECGRLERFIEEFERSADNKGSPGSAPHYFTLDLQEQGFDKQLVSLRKAVLVALDDPPAGDTMAESDKWRSLRLEDEGTLRAFPISPFLVRLYLPYFRQLGEKLKAMPQ